MYKHYEINELDIVYEKFVHSPGKNFPLFKILKLKDGSVLVDLYNTRSKDHEVISMEEFISLIA